MKIIYQKNSDFLSQLNKLTESRDNSSLIKIDSTVNHIINEIKKRGDDALIEFIKKFDNTKLHKSQILINEKIRKKYCKLVEKKIIKSFKTAINNITEFHKKQLPKNYEISKNNVVKGCLWKPIESVGLYVPGGNASYPSSLLMNVIPAKVAGVKRIVVTTPCKDNTFNPYVIFLLDLLNIKEVYQIGGAQAIAALAYGTQSIKPVNKIFGPGNDYVISAKKQVFGKVGIDLMAGPSEVVVVADKYNNPSWIAADLIAQAEHDKKSQSILITDNEKFAFQVIDKIKDLISNLHNNKIVKESLKKYGAILLLESLENSSDIIDIIAPEHLHLQSKNAKKIFKKVNNAGCVFLGKYTSEVFGDYIIGTNHILPTAGSAKYSSGLGVNDFMKKTSYASMNLRSFNNLSNKVIDMASVENLEGHMMSVKIRQSKKK